MDHLSHFFTRSTPKSSLHCIDSRKVNDSESESESFKSIFSFILSPDSHRFQNRGHESGLFGPFPEDDTTRVDNTIIHGDEESPVELDIDREVVRMESLEVYILVAELTSIAAFSTVLGIVRPNIGSQYIEELIFYYLILFFSSMSAISGLYATGVFSLCVLYGKTALGINRDSMYQIFVMRTNIYRIRGFRAFTASLLLFSLQILTITCKKIGGPLFIRIPLSIIATCFAYIIFQDWDTVMKIATPIFTNKLPETPEFGEFAIQQHEQKHQRTQKQLVRTSKRRGGSRRRVNQALRIKKEKGGKIYRNGNGANNNCYVDSFNDEHHSVSSAASNKRRRGVSLQNFRQDGNMTASTIRSNTRTSCHGISLHSSGTTNNKPRPISPAVSAESKRRCGVYLQSCRTDSGMTASTTLSSTRSISSAFSMTSMPSTEFPTVAERVQ